MSMLELFEALDRLIENKPIRVPKGTKITNDSVSLEAGKSKGSIKKSRPIYEKLIEAIAQAQDSQTKKSGTPPNEKIKSLKEELNALNKLYLESINREIILHERLKNIEEELSKYQSGKVTNINRARNKPLDP